MANPRILLVDPDRERRTELVERLTRLRYEVREAHDGVQAIARLETEEPDLILCQLDVTGHSPKELCDYVHEFVPGHVPVVLLCPADSLEIPRLVREAGADARSRRRSRTPSSTGLLFCCSGSGTCACRWITFRRRTPSCARSSARRRPWIRAPTSTASTFSSTSS